MRFPFARRWFLVPRARNAGRVAVRKSRLSGGLLGPIPIKEYYR